MWGSAQSNPPALNAVKFSNAVLLYAKPFTFSSAISAKLKFPTCVFLVHLPRGSFPFVDSMKIIAIGDISAGKTSLLRRHVDGIFTEGYKATVGVDFFVKGDVQFWDIAGQERFGAMTRSFYRGADGAMIVMDWNSDISLRNAIRWLEDLNAKMDGQKIPIILLCNKSDLPSVYSLEDIEAQVKLHSPQMIQWFSVSAKTGNQVSEAFHFLVEYVREGRRKEEEEEEVGVVDLSAGQESKRGSCC